jgi:glycosyltransferase involved in cell wall biosynthesis
MTAAISVVIPAHNAGMYVGDAIASVLSQDDVRVVEVIVVDDGSSDDTAAIADRFGSPVVCLRQRQAGAGVARNQGVTAATSEFVAFLDADDVWTSNSLIARYAVLASDSGLDAVFGHVEQFVCDRLTAAERDRLRFTPGPLPGWCCGAMLIRRTAFDRVGMFPAHGQGAEFIEWYLHALRQGFRSTMLPAVVVRRRLHATNFGRTSPDVRGEYLRIVRAELAHRRAEAASLGLRNPEH